MPDSRRKRLAVDIRPMDIDDLSSVYLSLAVAISGSAERPG